MKRKCKAVKTTSKLSLTLGLTSLLIAVSACSPQQEDTSSLRSSEKMPSLQDLPEEAMEYGFALTYSKLPRCYSFRDGEVRYVVDQQKFYTCDYNNGRKWVEIDIIGEKGDKGDTGAQGIQGEKGDTGAQGEQGIQGEKGDKGDQGEKGDTGANGQQGFIHGKDGEDSRSKLATVDATVAECANGGVKVVNYLDMDDSSDYDELIDSLIQTKLVCNGTNGANGTDGANGLNSLVDIQACPVSGHSIHTGLDLNADGILQENERQNTTDMSCRGVTHEYSCVLDELSNYDQFNVGDTCKFTLTFDESVPPAGQPIEVAVYNGLLQSMEFSVNGQTFTSKTGGFPGNIVVQDSSMYYDNMQINIPDFSDNFPNYKNLRLQLDIRSAGANSLFDSTELIIDPFDFSGARWQYINFSGEYNGTECDNAIDPSNCKVEKRLKIRANITDWKRIK